MNKSNRLRTQVTILVILSFLVFSFILSFLNLYSSYQILQTESKARLINLADFYASELDTQIILRSTITQNVVSYVEATFDVERAKNDPGYMDEYIDDIDPVLLEIAEKYEDAYLYMNPFLDETVREIWYWDQDRDGIPERMPGIEYEFFLDDEGKEWFFVPMRTKEAYWTNPYPSTVLADKGVKWISYTAPIYKDDFFIGITGNEFYYNEFEEEFKSIQVYNTGYAILLNDSGDFLVHPDFEMNTSIYEVGGGTYAWMMDEIVGKDKGIIEYTWINGLEKVLAYSRVSNGWIVAITSEKYEIFGALLDQMKIQVGVIIIGTLLAGLIISRLIGERMVMLEGVTKTISNIGNGDYETEIPNRYLKESSEVGMLANAVDVMKKKQKESFIQIRNYSENLESLVEERTQALERTNNELEMSIHELKQTQNQLIETQKTEAISRLIVEIAHRMNTPLGNVSMSISYLEYVSEQLVREGCTDEVFRGKILKSLDESINVASVGTSELSEIVRGLQLLTSEIEQKVQMETIIEEVIRLSIADFNSKFVRKKSVLADIPDTETRIQSSPVHLMEALHYLLKYTTEYSVAKDHDKTVRIGVKNEAGHVSISYKDNSELMYKDFGHKAFEPYAFASFDASSSGVELMMVYNLVTSGLGGCIECLEDKDGRPYFEIYLPYSMDGGGEED